MARDIKTLHIELSSIPSDLCPRSHSNVRGYPYNQGFTETNLSLNDCKKIFSPTFLTSLKKIIIGGNFGDFVTNPESLEIIRYFQEYFYGDIQINTNGTQRDHEFWKTLAQLGVTIFFSIDGLKDTHSLSMPGTDFDTVLKNAQSFIDNGGYAVWKMAVTDRNRHQTEAADMKSIELGFANFILNEVGPDENVLYDRSGDKIYQYQESTFWPEKINNEFIKDKIDRVKDCSIPARLVDIKIQPRCVDEGSIYISADGYVYPCTLAGVNPAGFKPYMRNPWRYYNPELMEYISDNHAPTVGLESAIAWFEKIEKSWTSEQQPRLCQTFCGAKHD